MKQLSSMNRQKKRLELIKQHTDGARRFLVFNVSIFSSDFSFVSFCSFDTCLLSSLALTSCLTFISSFSFTFVGVVLFESSPLLDCLCTKLRTKGSFFFMLDGKGLWLSPVSCRSKGNNNLKMQCYMKVMRSVSFKNKTQWFFFIVYYYFVLVNNTLNAFLA